MASKRWRGGQPALGGPWWLAAWTCAGALSGCSPQWANGVQPRVQTSGPSRQTGAADPAADPLERYTALPLGVRVRDKRIRVLLISVGDIAIYAHRPTDQPPTFTSVLRSYTSFKSNAVEGVDEFLNDITAAYVLPAGEIESVRQFIKQAIANVEYFRVDVRYTVDAAHGAVLVHEFVEEGPDRLLDRRLITPTAALAVIHYTDYDGWDLDKNETFLASHYLAQERGGKLVIEPKKTH